MGEIGFSNNKEGELDEADQPLIFEASTQQLVRTMYVAIRTTIPISSLLPAVRSQVKPLDPELPLSDVSTIQQVVADTLVNPRLESGVVGIFSICALSLTFIGLYAFISYVTLQRTQEIGIRVALGAQRFHIFWIVTKDALKLALVGIAAGVAAVFTFTKLLASRNLGDAYARNKCSDSSMPRAVVTGFDCFVYPCFSRSPHPAVTTRSTGAFFLRATRWPCAMRLP